MRHLCALVFALASTSAMAAPYVIDPLASLPYATQQIQAKVPQPHYFLIETFATGAQDASCAALGWRYSFLTVPAAANGWLQVWLQRQGNACVWASALTVQQGPVMDVVPFDDVLTQGKVLSVASVLNAIQEQIGQPLAVSSISLNYTPVSAQAPELVYNVHGSFCGPMSALTADAASGKITYSTYLGDCPAQAGVLVSLRLDGLFEYGTEGARIYRDGRAETFVGPNVKPQATLSPERLKELTAQVNGLVSQPLQDITVMPQEPCPQDIGDALYTAYNQAGESLLFYQDRPDCHQLRLPGDDVLKLKEVLDSVEGLGTGA